MKKWIVLHHNQFSTTAYLVEHPSEPTMDELLTDIQGLDEKYLGARMDDNPDFFADEWLEVFECDGVFKTLREAVRQ